VKKSLTSWGLIWIIVALVFTLHAGAPALYAQGPTGDAEADIGIQNEAFELEVIRLVNQERVSRGLHPLRLNTNLRDSARDHNQDMIDNDFFDHEGSDGSLPWDRACDHGYTPYGSSCYVGENIAGGYSTPAAVFNAWMSSQGHRDNMLNSEYREIGVGHTTGGAFSHYWTMDLGAQPLVLPVFINNDEDETSSRQVTITLTKEDVSSWGSIGPITGVQISEDPSFAGATWQPWSQTMPFTLSSGNGTKTVYVRFTDGSTQVTSSDTITLNEPIPSLSLSTNKITFLAEVGSGQTSPASITFVINNDGGDVLHWTAADDAGWLILGSTSGDAPASVDVWVDNSSGILDSLGKKTATITVTATNPDAVNTPQTISVVLNVVEEIHAIYLPLVVQ
jgi:uncharacterized protein YkwD